MKTRLHYGSAAPGAMKAMDALESYIESCSIEPELQDLVKLRASQLNGCAYCVDMHSLDLRANGETEQRIYALPVWQETPFFSERERAALLWTETLTLLAQTHAPDEVFAQVRPHFTDTELADLTMVIGTINVWNRFGAGFRSLPGHYKPTPRAKTEKAEPVEAEAPANA